MLRTAMGDNVTGRTQIFKRFFLDQTRDNFAWCLGAFTLSSQGLYRSKRTKSTSPTKTREVSLWRSQLTHLVWTHKWILRQDKTSWVSPCNMYLDCSNEQQQQQQQHVFVQETVKIMNHNSRVTKGVKLGFSVMTPKPNIRNKCWTFQTCSVFATDRNAQSTEQFGRGPSEADDDQ